MLGAIKIHSGVLFCSPNKCSPNAISLQANSCILSNFWKFSRLLRFLMGWQGNHFYSSADLMKLWHKPPFSLKLDSAVEQQNNSWRSIFFPTHFSTEIKITQGKGALHTELNTAFSIPHQLCVEDDINDLYSRNMSSFSLPDWCQQNNFGVPAVHKLQFRLRQRLHLGQFRAPTH